MGIAVISPWAFIGFESISHGLLLSFWLLLICVAGIANGPVGLVVFYEQDVKDRVVELGLTTAEKIKKISASLGLALFIPQLTVIPAVVYLYNGVNGFLQLLGIYMIADLFDRLFIDEWWVGHTKAWIIPGTEDFGDPVGRQGNGRCSATGN